MTRTWAGLLGIAALLPAPAMAEGALSARLSAGLQYDSNVTIDEIDRVSRVGDSATVIEAQGAWKTSLARKTDLRLSYNLYHTQHDDFTSFNQFSQAAGLDLNRNFGKLSAVLTWRLNRTQLAGKDFSRSNQLSAGLGRSFGKQWQLRGNYSWSDRSYDGRPGRDATSQALSLDGFYYLSSPANFVTAGLRHTREDAKTAQFSFDGDGWRARLGRRFRWGDNILSGQLAWQYEDRRYDGVTASIGAPRHDRRGGVSARLDIPVTADFTLSGDYAVSDYGSNLPSADYSQQVATIRILKDF